jgi:8-oxo-dGTP pyrophosphatase MutT (NUDIX family)
MDTIHRKIVSALLLSNDQKILMGMKDPKNGGVYLDCWHIPGGGIDDGEDQVAALIREVSEETGLDISSSKIILIDDKGSEEAIKLQKETGEKILCKMKFTVYRVNLNRDANDVTVQPNDDLINLKWIDVNYLQNYKLTPPSITLFKRLGYL